MMGDQGDNNVAFSQLVHEHERLKRMYTERALDMAELRTIIFSKDSRIAELEAAVRVLAELAYCQANRERILEMDATNHPEVAEMGITNGVRLIKALGEANNNPLASAALASARTTQQEKPA